MHSNLPCYMPLCYRLLRRPPAFGPAFAEASFPSEQLRDVDAGRITQRPGWELHEVLQGLCSVPSR